MVTDVGPVQLDVPRDRDGTFEPQTVKKRCVVKGSPATPRRERMIPRDDGGSRSAGHYLGSW